MRFVEAELLSNSLDILDSRVDIGWPLTHRYAFDAPTSLPSQTLVVVGKRLFGTFGVYVNDVSGC